MNRIFLSIFFITLMVSFSCSTYEPLKPSVTDRYDEFEGTRSIEMLVHSDSNEFYLKYGSLPIIEPNPNKSIFLHYIKKGKKQLIYFEFGTTSSNNIFQIQKVSISFDGNIQEASLESNKIVGKSHFQTYSVIEFNFLSQLSNAKIVRLKYYYQDEQSQIIELMPYQIDKLKYFVDYLLEKSLVQQ